MAVIRAYDEISTTINGIGRILMATNCHSVWMSLSWFRLGVFQSPFTIGNGKYIIEYDFFFLEFKQYWFLTRFYEFVVPTVDADAGTAPKDSTVDEDTTDDESLSEEDQQVKKKQKREKVGFRDRKVNHCCLCLHCQKHPTTIQISYRFVYDFLFFFS